MPFICTPNLDWLWLAVPVALLSLFIPVLLSFVARFFGLQPLSMWVKAEYAQAAVSFLVIAFVLAMQTAGCSVVGEVALDVAAASGNVHLVGATGSGTIADPNQIAKGYIIAVTRCADRIWTFAYILNWLPEIVKGMSLDVRGAEAISGGLAFTGIVTVLHYIANGMVYVAVFHFIEYHLLSLAQYTMLPIFLPIGLLLRSFPLTRGAGGLVTAFALGFAFVFPMSLVVINAMMPNVGYACAQVDVKLNDNPFSKMDQCSANVGSQISMLSQLRGNADDLDSLIALLQRTLGLLYLISVVYPTVALIITFTFIRQTGSLFGADLAEIGRGLIKLI